jgi:ABC-2 type transport system ATP-binding protein
MIRLHHIEKQYGTAKVLKSINAEFEAGHVYGIVGKNGAGKTTLFNCIAGLTSYSGTIKSPYSPLRTHIAYLQTEPPFIDKLTAKEYLKLMLIGRALPFPNFEASNIFDLPLNKFVETYSTGMKKKLALTGAILLKSDVYILDEPFNGLDIESSFNVTALINHLKEKGKTVLVSSHIFSTLQESCDTIGILEDGCVTRWVPKTDFAALGDELKKQATINLHKRLDL